MVGHPFLYRIGEEFAVIRTRIGRSLDRDCNFSEADLNEAARPADASFVGSGKLESRANRFWIRAKQVGTYRS